MKFRRKSVVVEMEIEPIKNTLQGYPTHLFTFWRDELINWESVDSHHITIDWEPVDAEAKAAWKEVYGEEYDDTSS